MTASNNSQEIALVFNPDEFKGRLSVLALKDGEYDYYTVDLSRFTSRLERIYFLNLAYAEPKIISIDGSINHEQIWFKAYHQYKEPEITCIFSDLKEKSEQACNSMSPDEKASWLKKFDKFEK